MRRSAPTDGRERMQGAGLDRALPYLLLAPACSSVLAVLVYPLWDGLRASTQFYRYGRPIADVGFDNYCQALERSASSSTRSGSRCGSSPSPSPSRRCSGSALALFCLREFTGIRLLRTVLIIPMVITPGGGRASSSA